jgi:iron(III) transport system permease protein
MLWDTRLERAVYNSLLVSGGTAALATVLGMVLALSIVVLRVPGRRLLSWGIVSLVLVPLYVQATAWSAGFGSQGWFRWNQVTAVLNTNYAVLACIWIQASASIPVTYLLLSIGVRRSLDSHTQLSLLDRSAGKTLITSVLRKAMPWLVATFCFVFVWSNADMVVTNLFQVPTLTEAFYQQVQFGKWNVATNATALLYALAIGLFVGSIAYGFGERGMGQEVDNPTMDGAFVSYRLLRWLASGVAWCILIVFCLIPILSLFVKAGWTVTNVDQQVLRYWSLRTFATSISGIGSFREEFGWSLSISTYATILALIVSVGLVRFLKNRWQVACVLAALGFGLVLPGPAINLLFHWLSGTGVEFLVRLRDDSVVFVVLALQFRCLPILYVIHWISVCRFRERYRDSLVLDRSSLWTHRAAMFRPTVVACVTSFFIAFANLETYLLILPPGVTTVSMRSFELLHYGVQNKEAGLSVCLILGSIATAIVLQWMSPNRRA